MLKVVGTVAMLASLWQLARVWRLLDQYRRYWRESAKIRQAIDRIESASTSDVMERGILYRTAYAAIHTYHLPMIAATRCSEVELPGYVLVPEGYPTLAGLWLAPQTWDWLRAKEIDKLPDDPDRLTKDDLVRVNRFFKPGSSAAAGIILRLIFAAVLLASAVLAFRA